MNKNPLIRMLNSPSKGIEETRGLNGALARLWRQILGDRNIRLPVWGDLMREYVRTQSSNVVDQTSIRGNLAKALASKNITWLVFCKGLQLLGYREFTYTIKATDKHGRTFKHETHVVIASRDDVPSSEDSGEDNE